LLEKVLSVYKMPSVVILKVKCSYTICTLHHMKKATNLTMIPFDNESYCYTKTKLTDSLVICIIQAMHSSHLDSTLKTVYVKCSSDTQKVRKNMINVTT